MAYFDLDNLLSEGKITQAEYIKFSQFSSETTHSLAFNILIAFGVFAVSCAAIALVPTPWTAIFLGACLCGLAVGLLNVSERWHLLGKMCMPIGAILLAGGILWFYHASPTAWILATALFLAGGIVTQQALLIVLAVLALSATIGAAFSYYHATYVMYIQQPTITILLFGFLSLFSYWLSKKLLPNYDRLSIIASRTCLFLVNLGFWVGSLWGDILPNKIDIPDGIFAILWAIFLIVVAIWAAKKDKRWVLNVAAVFGAIHFYSQWFEHLGTTPGTVLIAGIIALCFAFGIKQLNMKFKMTGLNQAKPK